MRPLIILASVAFATAAAAQEPVGCDKFKWPLDREKALLAAARPVASGSEAQAAAVKIALLPLAEARLPLPPTRNPKPDTFAGYVRVPAPERAGTYRITLSQGGWIDAFQNEHEVKSGAFSGAAGCDGLRKSVKFELTTAPLLIEVSGVPMRDIAIAVTPDQ
jgi:hypothetical protein